MPESFVIVSFHFQPCLVEGGEVMRRLFQIAALLCVAMGVASAQTSGTVTGEVKDQTGAMVPNAAVTATNTETNVARTTLTNTSGVYSFPGLIPGTYQVKVAAGGFQ